MTTIEQSELPPRPEEFAGIPTFVVGGWVRDTLRPNGEPSDVDLMVAAVSREELLDRGFREIDSPNNDTFGVFQDSLGREVAVAREEVSTGEGHTGFDVEPIDASIPADEALSRDLERRDLTINAMAVSFDGRLFDPHNGQQDLDEGIIRAVDLDAFKQDPLRILRAARFAARFGFDISENTKGAMWESVPSLKSLPQERVRMELEKVLVQADEPSRFFDILDEVAAVDYTFPELDDLRKVPAGPVEFHEEGSAFRHTMMVLDEMAALRPNDELAMLQALAHDLGKSQTPPADLPSHKEHGKDGVRQVREMMARLGLSNEQAKMMKDACRFHTRMHDIEDLNESTVLDTLEQADDPARLVSLAIADKRGRQPSQEFDAALAFRRFSAAAQAREEWTGARLIDEGYSPDEMGGENFGNLLRQKRVERMRELESKALYQ